MSWMKDQKLQGGKYVIDQVLGQGGFGTTYKAFDVGLKKTVVIKTPSEYLKNDENYDKYIKQFIQEGRVLEQLSQSPHPHIVRVIDRFQEGSTHCLVMNFVPGENLFQMVRRKGALPESEIIQYIRQIGEALTVVHQAGLVHRDAHPGNIMLESDSKAVLIDFGIAKQVVPSAISSTNKAGNQGYAPYEQTLRGSRQPTVDIYSLAATLYYAVTGRSPTSSLDRKLDNDSLIPAKQIVPDISDQLNKAILKGMALEPEDRPQSMQQWLAMLEVAKAMPSPKIQPSYSIEVIRPQSKSQSAFASLNELEQMLAKDELESDFRLSRLPLHLLVPISLIVYAGWIGYFIRLTRDGSNITFWVWAVTVILAIMPLIISCTLRM
ncbi:serine/threonine protein kinase [Calothrix sp. NIES-2100]|uniref:serine/threonine protein kinase n=1 Tax=Calothrix sp. NIES-2100 TaxID=1954172 RepID=UPI000B5E4B54|nr:serine/threonine protein kinase [Calothrix sp. NIES-2100]